MNWNNNGGFPGGGHGGFPAPQQHFPAAPAFGGGGGGNPFGGINEADASGQSLPYFEDGDYLVRIDTLKYVNSRKGGSLVFIETTIVESSNPNRPAGMQVSASVKLNSDMGPINYKRFMIAAMGYKISDLPPKSPVAPDGKTWDAHAAESITPAQPFRGRMCRVQARTQEKKTSAGEFTNIIWSPADAHGAQPQQQTNPTQYGMPAPHVAQPQQQQMPQQPQQQAPQQMPASFNPGMPAPQQMPAGFNPGMPAPQQMPAGFNPGMPAQQPQQMPAGFNPGMPAQPSFPGGAAPAPGGFNPPQGWNPGR